MRRHIDSTTQVLLHVEGMDCASCAGKIETALAHMPGVSDVRLSFATERLELALAPGSATTVGDIETTVKRLGFGVSDGVSHDGTGGVAAGRSGVAGRRWWQTAKGRHVLGLGILMGAAYVLALLLPKHGTWVFAAVVLVGVAPFARKAWALAMSGSPFSIETLMSVAALGALVIGEAEEAAAVVFLFSVGELLESVAASHARAGIKSLARLVPTTAVLLDAHGGQREVDASLLQVDDRVLVRPGDRVPADGGIIEGASSLDESPITGESIPCGKTAGDAVFAGSINIDGVLQVRVDKAAADNTISRIVHMVEQAQATKAPTARFMERFSRRYTPAVMVIAAGVMLLPPLAMGAGWHEWIYRGLALLLIACPCALVLSTPAAIAAGLAAGTRRGLLVKGGHALERIGAVHTVAFDKTGTLTEGKPRVTDVVAWRGAQDEVVALAASVESGSAHPLAMAVASHAAAAEVVVPAASNAYVSAGRAVHATVAGRKLAVGSPACAAEGATLASGQLARMKALQHEGKTVAVLFDEQSREALGLIAFRDEPRQDALAGVTRLKAMGVGTVMLTGDNRHTAQAIAAGLGLAHEAELLPGDKLRRIGELKREGRIAMVGDGINDAPALAAADVGIAMGGGADVAIETADAAVLGNRVTDVADLVALSRATMANIRQNVAFALGLKAVFLITTILGLTGLWAAVLADTGATAIVTLNALRLLRFNGGGDAPDVSGHQPATGVSAQRGSRCSAHRCH